MTTFKIDFGAGFDVAESPADKFNITLDLSEIGVILSGLDAAKPAAAVANHLYWATDTGILYRDTGAAWSEVVRGETFSRLAQLTEKSHASLTNVTADQHHAQLHAAAHAAAAGDDIGGQAMAITGNWDVTGITGRLKIQTGAGAPSHSEAEGTLYWDTTNNKLYCNNDGATAWTEVGTGSGGPTTVRKTADETVTSSTVLQNDNHLLLAMAANEIWEVRFKLMVTAAQAGDIKYAFTVPAGATVKHTYFGPVIGVTATPFVTYSATLQDAAVDRSPGILDVSDPTLVIIEAIVVCGATPGNLQLQWAQNTSNATATTVLANSCLIAHKLA